ncbi:MAG: aldehyde dehydrogenase [Pseudohongiella sp.]|nr:MAG: aldehyde dehydrogenase [Pseudohongiella sp.]
MNKARDKTCIRTISPIDDTVYVERPLASEQEIEQSIALSRSAQKQWQQTTLEERATICELAVQYFEARATQIGEEITRQMGRPIAYSASEVGGLAERARYMIAIAEQALADEVPEAIPGFTRFIRREPLGIVFTVAPWNYPLLTTVNSVIPALMAGNSVLLKPSAQTPLCGEHFTTAFRQAGLPEGVIQCLHMSHQNTSKLLSDSLVDFACFTGSVAAGQNIEQSAATNFIGLGLELGGKDPAYVRSDAILDNCVSQLVDGAFFNSGQSCCGIERIYAHEAVYSDFVEAFVEQVRKYKLANPLLAETTLGPMVRNAAADAVRQQTEQAVAQGAKPCIDHALFANSREGTPYLAPQVLLDVHHGMSAMREESFGPVVGIMSVKDDEEALQLMNDSDLGLTASLWTQDQAEAELIGGQLQTGTVFMNRCDYLDPALAWTGVKQTGRGVTLSRLGYLQLSRAKSFHLKTI